MRSSLAVRAAVVGTAAWALFAAPLRAQSDCARDGRRATGFVATVDAGVGLAATVADWREDAPATGWRWYEGSDVRAQFSDATAPLHLLGSFRLLDGARRALEARCVAPARARTLALLYAGGAGVVKEVVDGWYGGASAADLALDAAGLALALQHARSPRWQALVPAMAFDPTIPREAAASDALSSWLLLTPRRAASGGEDARGLLAMLRVGVGRRVFADGREQLLVGVDLDAAGLPLEGAGWRAALGLVRHVRLPGPMLVLEDGAVRGVVVGW